MGMRQLWSKMFCPFPPVVMFIRFDGGDAAPMGGGDAAPAGGAPTGGAPTPPPAAPAA